jgi:hypothetical protein
MAHDAWERLLPATYPQGRSERFVKQQVEAAVHEAGHAVMAVLQHIPFGSVSISGEFLDPVPVPGQPGSRMAEGGGFNIAGPVNAPMLAGYVMVLSAGSAATRLVLGWASQRGDLQDRADFAEALGAARQAFPGGEWSSINYDAASREAFSLLRDTVGAKEAIEDVARTLLAKSVLEPDEVAARAEVFLKHRR